MDLFFQRCPLRRLYRNMFTLEILLTSVANNDVNQRNYTYFLSYNSFTRGVDYYFNRLDILLPFSLINADFMLGRLKCAWKPFHWRTITIYTFITPHHIFYWEKIAFKLNWRNRRPILNYNKLRSRQNCMYVLYYIHHIFIISAKMIHSSMEWNELIHFNEIIKRICIYVQCACINTAIYWK